MSRRNRHHPRHRHGVARPTLPRLAAELAWLTIARGVTQELLPGGMVVLQRDGRVVALLDTGDENTARRLIGVPPQPSRDPHADLLFEVDRRDPGCCQVPEEDDHALAC
jgi:hypothetical protein